MPYATLAKDVQLGSGQTLAFAKGRGYYAKGGPTTPAGGSSSLYATALKLAQDQQKPTLDAINSERERAAKDSAASVANQTAFSEALAKLYGAQAPSIHDTYDTAAGTTAAFGKGFSAAEEHLRGDESAKLSDFLSKTGASPDVIASATKQTGAGSGLSDVEYGLNGYIPAAGLTREGAAFEAAAKMLPAQARGQGQMTVAQLLKSASDADLQYGQQANTERGKIPSIATQLLNDMVSQANAQRSIDIQEKYLNNTQRSTEASITGVDPATGEPIKGYHLDANGVVTKDKTPGTTSASSKAAKAREAAFASAQTHIFDDVQALSKPMTRDEQIAWLVAHPGSKLADAPATHAPPYAAAAKAMFDKYKYLLRFASRSGQPALKKRLNQIIREALAAQGVYPPAPVSKGPTIPVGPTVPGMLAPPNAGA